MIVINFHLPVRRLLRPHLTGMIIAFFNASRRPQVYFDRRSLLPDKVARATFGSCVTLMPVARRSGEDRCRRLQTASSAVHAELPGVPRGLNAMPSISTSLTRNQRRLLSRKTLKALFSERKDTPLFDQTHACLKPRWSRFPLTSPNGGVRRTGENSQEVG